MMKQALSHFPDPWLMALALGLFVVAMTIILAKTFSPRRSAEHRRMAQLPLLED